MTIMDIISIFSFSILTIQIIQTRHPTLTKFRLQAILVILGWITAMCWIACGATTQDLGVAVTALIMAIGFVAYTAITLQNLGRLEPKLPKNKIMRKAHFWLEKLEKEYNRVKSNAEDPAIERAINEITSLIKSNKNAGELEEPIKELAENVFPEYVRKYIENIYVQTNVEDEEEKQYYIDQMTEYTDNFLMYIAMAKDIRQSEKE